jgi:methanogenic corrinoid protein MtbC1
MLELARSALTGDVVNLDFLHCRGGSSQGASSAESATYDEGAEANLKFAPLIKAIESEIIPRLMFAHRLTESPLTPVKICLEKPSQAEVFALTQLLLKQDTLQSADFVEAMRKRGMMQECLYLELLAPAARSLGEMWEADACDFVEVTLALGRLHQLLRLLSLAFRDQEQDQTTVPDRKRLRKVLLTTAPGEQHCFGLAIVAEFFERAGWGVWGSHQKMNQDLPAVVRSEWFDAAGFSVGCECRLDSLATGICALRSASLNDRIAIMVGGPLFVDHPEYAAMVGADASASDARQAVVEAERLVDLRR